MSAPSPTPIVPSLPVAATAAAVYALLWTGLDEFLRLGLLPIAASFLIAVLAEGVSGSGGWMLALAANLVPTTIFAIAWLRYALLGPQPAAGGLAVRWGRRETAYLWRSLVLGLGASLAVALAVSLAMATPQQAAGLPIVLVAALAAVYLMLRLALVLPASAVDAAYDFARSWADTGSQGLRLVALMLLVVLPLWLALGALNGLAHLLGLVEAAPLTLLLVDTIAGYLFVAATLAVLAQAFRRLADRPPPLAGD